MTEIHFEKLHKVERLFASGASLEEIGMAAFDWLDELIATAAEEEEKLRVICHG